MLLPEAHSCAGLALDHYLALHLGFAKWLRWAHLRVGRNIHKIWLEDLCAVVLACQKFRIAFILDRHHIWADKFVLKCDLVQYVRWVIVGIDFLRASGRRTVKPGARLVSRGLRQTTDRVGVSIAFLERNVEFDTDDIRFLS